MFIAEALAQDAGGAGPGALGAFLPIILIFVVFYFLLIRPQQKKMKQHKEMLAAIRRGDRIVTGGGIVGTVSKVIDDNEVQVDIAEGVRVRVQRALISTVLAKPQPATEAKDTKEGRGSSAGGGTPGGAEEGRGARLKKMLGGKSD